MQKVFWTPRARGLLHWCQMGLHRCKRGFGWCKRLLGDLCSLGPKESKRPFAAFLNHFWRLSLFRLAIVRADFPFFSVVFGDFFPIFDRGKFSTVSHFFPFLSFGPFSIVQQARTIAILGNFPGPQHPKDLSPSS